MTKDAQVSVAFCRTVLCSISAQQNDSPSLEFVLYCNAAVAVSVITVKLDLVNGKGNR